MEVAWRAEPALFLDICLWQFELTLTFDAIELFPVVTMFSVSQGDHLAYWVHEKVFANMV